MKTPRAVAALVLLALIIGGGFWAYSAGVFTPDEPDFDETGPRIVALTTLLVVFMASLVFGPARLRDVLQGALMWGALALLLVAGYAYKDDLVKGGYRVLGALAPGLAVPHEGGSILVIRDASGHFQIEGKANNASIRFLLDTGASAVVLTYGDAEAAGFHPAKLSFSVPVSTANGRAMVAPVQLETLKISGLTLHNVRAFVSQDGALQSSLLGMNALDRLSSWRIEGDKLIMVP
ncbi:retropepsin-like aspartic protease family protein [Roseibium litorale]|uniref:TIGR02281 family clan AA aspartic protease n=1 Tax=Roseibium litorale TaxID=2803841 RepID=A0ABR9CR97_9HYPH|nr:TIGR02281 family clan AA aspartic protease [Roseibium litorale]MBD8893401.1 TIGR02281 family clan AA aspartic protease [Roseibium litorale]